MKSILIVLFSFFATFSLVAGGFDPYKVDPKFEKELAPILSTIDSVGGPAYAAVLPTFKSLSTKYPKEWRGYYWEALGNIRKAEIDSTGEKDHLLDEAERLINRAEMFIKGNAELYLIRAWALKLRIDVDTATRTAKYGSELNWYLSEAYRVDQGNPRYYYLKGRWSEVDTSEAGKKETFRYYRSAKLLFQDRPQGKYITEPDWGRGETDMALGVFAPPNFNFDDPTGELAKAVADSIAKAGTKETFKEEVIPKEMVGGKLPESLNNEEAGTIEITENGAKYSSNKSGSDKREKVKKDKKADKTPAEEPKESKDAKGKKDKKGKSGKDKSDDGKSSISVGKDGEAAGTETKKEDKSKKSKDKKEDKKEEPKKKEDKKSKKK